MRLRSLQALRAAGVLRMMGFDGLYMTLYLMAASVSPIVPLRASVQTVFVLPA